LGPFLVQVLLHAAPQRISREQGRHWTLESREIDLFDTCPKALSFSDGKFHRLRDPDLTICRATT
jgi:hypothetical protein